MRGIEYLLAQWLYRIRITLEGNRLLNMYRTALVSAVRDLRVPGRTEPLDIESIYVPLRVAEYSRQQMAPTEQETVQRGQVPARTLSIEDALRGSPHMVLLGEPGSGKSTALKNLALRFIREEIPADYVRQLTLRLQDRPLERLLPIIVSLPDFARRDLDLFAYLAEVFAAHQFPYPHLFIAERLEKGECLLLLDDLGKIADEEQRGQVATEIQHLTGQYPLNPVIVTSRRDDDPRLLPRFRRWWVLGLDDAGIGDLVHRWYAEQPEQAQALLRAMDRNPRFRSLAANPLLLSVLLVGYDSDQERPVRCAALCQRLLRILVEQDEASSFEPTLKGQVLQELALELHTRRARSLGKSELWEKMKVALSCSGQADRADELLEELVSTNILWPGPEGTYGFVHLAFQEYLTARAVFEQSKLETIAGHVDDPWYEEIFVLLAGLQREAHELIGMIRERSQNPQRALFLVARCLAEADQTDDTLRANIERELFELFREEAPELWTEAAAAIAGIEDKSVKEALIGFLKAQDPELRQNAVWALGRIGKEWAAVPLISALEDLSPCVRKRAAWALGQIRDERAIRPLIRVFGDQDQGVAEEAALAVAAIGSSAVEPLIRSLSAPEEQVRKRTMMALSRIGAPAVSLLIEALGNERDEVREGAKLALIRVGEPGVEQLVRAFAKARGDLLREIVDVLVEIGDLRVLRPMINALPDARGEMRQALTKALVTFGEPALDELIEALIDMNFREVAMEALVAFEDLATARLSVALEDKRWEMRWRAAQSLGELHRAEALEPLIGVLEDSRREVRRAAADALRKIGDTRAVESLIRALSDEDDAVRWEAAKALGELKDVRAIGPLISALTDEAESVRQNSASSLIEIGPDVVQPLIEALYERGSRRAGTYDYGVNVLDRISTRYETQDPLRAHLAATYCKLMTGRYTLDELLPSLGELSWWQHGSELYQMFRVLDSIMRCQSVEEVTVERGELDQLGSSIKWLLYTELRTWLRNFGKIVEDVAGYRMSSIEDTRQDALVRAQTAAKRLEDLATAFADPEIRILREVSEHLHRLIIEAIGRRAGRAKLQLTLRTDQVRIVVPNYHAVLAYDLENTGDAPAWNVRLALRAPAAQEFAIIEGRREYPHVLKPGERRRIEFLVTPSQVGSSALSFELAYDDAVKEGHLGKLSGGKVYFVEKPAPYRPPDGPSPYNTSQPVEAPDMFYGREDIIDWVQENLGSKYQENILVLHGHRRTGKSSVLTQLFLRQPGQRYFFVLIRIDQVGEFSSESDILYHMARVIQNQLGLQGIALSTPVRTEYQTTPRSRFTSFLQELDDALLDRRVALMIDEFDFLIEQIEKGRLDQSFFVFLRGQMQYSKKLSYIIAGTLKVTQMLKDGTSILFNTAKPRWIGYLRLGDAERLVREPIKGFLDYHDLAVEKILKTTAGHPYFVQYICDYLFQQARTKQSNYVDLIDVNMALHATTRDTTHNIVFDYKLLPASHRMTLAALSYVSDEWTHASTSEVQRILNRHGQGTLNALTILQELKDLDFATGQGNEYQFRLELLRLWLEAHTKLPTPSEV